MDLSHYVETEPTADIIKWVKSKRNMPNFNELKYLLLNNSLKYKRLDLVTFLLETNCSIKKPNEIEMFMNSPLHYAVILGNGSLVEDLLESQVSLFDVNREGNTGLHLAFIFKHEKIIDLLFTALKEISNYTNFKNKEGLTHLHIASTRMDATIVEKYLKAGANVTDAVSDKSMMWAGYTALHFATKYKSFAAVNVLLKYNAPRDSKDSNGQTALQLATDNLVELLNIIDVLSTPDADSTENTSTSMAHFHTACLKKDSHLVRSYIEKGANVNLTVSPEAEFCPSYTALHFAVESNYEDTVKLLLDHGADVNRANKNKMTPVHAALYKDYTNILDLVFAKVSDKVRKDRVDCNGLSYFHVACTRENCIDDVKKFLDSGRNVNERVSFGNHDYAGFTPLHFAVLYKRREISELLIDRGANVNALDGGKHGTPLYVALEDYSNRLALANLLIKKGAEVTAIRPGDEKTALHLIVDSMISEFRKDFSFFRGCLYSSHRCAIERAIDHFVMEYGIDVDAKDKDGNTILHLYTCSSLPSVKLLRLLLNFGADVNVENFANRTPFEEYSQLQNRYPYHDPCAMLYHHVQKLKSLGLEVNPKNEKVCENLVKKRLWWAEFGNEKLQRMQKERLDEIDRMKNTKIDEKVSVYDFAIGDEKSAVAYLDNELLKKFQVLTEAEKEYPLYGYLIRLKYLKVLRYLKNSAGSSLKRTASSELIRENAAKRPSSL